MTDIIVLTHNKEEKTCRCFESIALNTKNYRVLWVDNGSEEASIQKVLPFAEKLENFRLMRNKENEGFSKGVNCALRLFLFDGLSDHLILLNNDVVVTKGWLDHLIAAMKKSGLDAIGPVTSDNCQQSLEALRPQLSRKLPEFTDETTEEKARILYEDAGSAVYPVTSILTFFCVLFRRETVEQIGLLDENIFAYGEDNDYCERMKRTGKKMGLAVGIYVEHDHGATAQLFGDSWKEKQMKKASAYIQQKYNL